MSKDQKITKPTKKALIEELENSFDLSVRSIDDETYEKAIDGYERGLKIRTMASRCRFFISGGAKDKDKKKIAVEGIFLGSRDLVTKKKPLGKNKVHILSLLVKQADGTLELLTEPNAPTHFKGFKKDNFGALVCANIVVTEGDKGNFVSPSEVKVIDRHPVIDTSKIKTITSSQAAELEDYTECAVVATIASIWPLRVPQWEADNFEDEDYPIVMKGNPVLQMYMEHEDDEPILRASLHPTHLGRPVIHISDFDVIWNEGEVDLEEDLMPSFSGMRVILLGQKRSTSDYNDNTYVDFDVNAIIEVSEEPIVVETSTTAKKPSEKKESSADVEAKKNKARIAKVKETVTAIRGESTVDIVRSMHDTKFFLGVPDEDIQKIIDAEFKEQDINQEPEPVEEQPTEEPEVVIYQEEDIFA